MEREKMKPKFTLDNKMQAYDTAIDYLRMHESDSDEKGDKDCREWLAKKLDREIQRLVDNRKEIK